MDREVGVTVMSWCRDRGAQDGRLMGAEVNGGSWSQQPNRHKYARMEQGEKLLLFKVGVSQVDQRT